MRKSPSCAPFSQTTAVRPRASPIFHGNSRKINAEATQRQRARRRLPCAMTKSPARPVVRTGWLANSTRRAEEMPKLNQEIPTSRNNGVDELLAAYVKGWSEADPEKITAVTADDYDFHDPLVGRFSKHDLPHYFALLRVRFLVAAAPTRRDVGFRLPGPMSVGSKDVPAILARSLAPGAHR